MSIYRFRSVYALLDGVHELENQEIYFATTDELNDPMEGLREMYWQGDEIVWKNLIKNYVKALTDVFLVSVSAPANVTIDEKTIPVSRQLLGTGNVKKAETLQLILERLQKVPAYQQLPSLFVSRTTPIRRNELLIYFTILHPLILHIISDTSKEKGWVYASVFDRKPDTGLLLTQMIDTFEQFEKAIHASGAVPFDGALARTALNIQTFLLKPDFVKNYKQIQSRHFFVQWDFPQQFINSLEASILPTIYIASFVKDCANPTIWGHYGDSHKGVCLKFKERDHEGKPALMLETEYGYSNNSPTIGPFPHLISDVEYHNKHVEIDFFRRIWMLSRAELNALWYQDENGNISTCADHLKNHELSLVWGQDNWALTLGSANIKLSEWKYEQESRLVLHNMFQDYSQKNKRKLKYDFNDLEGLVFGIKTSLEDKVRIIEIISKKCKENNRADFSFYQAYYLKESGKIENMKLDIEL
ncbi:MAG: DUF2971 domain-containing protein [Sediminibacterium sp.]